MRAVAAVRSTWFLGAAGESLAMAKVADRIVVLPVADDVGDDAALVERARGGDRWAEEALYRRHGPRLLARVGRLLGDAVEAEDVVQEVFARAFARLAELREPAAFGGWVLRAAVRRVWGISRWRGVRRRFGLDRGAALYLAPNATVSPEERALLGELEAVLQRLGTAERIAWSLRAIEGLTLPEVAAACGCSLATAKRRIAAARARIAAEVGAVPDEGGDP
jgi:RNA polymerase sigma-70 factor (ECF subfamily)